VTATRARRRELAVLRALGMTGAQVRAAVRWQALLIVAVAALIGIPLGVAIGRVAWSLLADRLGAPIDLVAPTAMLALTTAIAIVGAVIVSIIPARREAALSPTAALHTE
jgi:ABC-type antimicrobial peptide transport system permease subunit